MNGMRKGGQEHKVYNSHLDKNRYILPPGDGEAFPVYHLYVIRTGYRDELRFFLKNKGIGTEIHYPVPIHRQKAYLDLGLRKVKLPVTEKYSKEILSLPIFPELKLNTVKKISRLINTFFK